MGNGWVDEYHSPGDVALFDRPFFNRPDRLTGDAVEHIEERLFTGNHDGFDGAAIHRDVGEDGRRGHIHIPERMVDELKMPFTLAGLEIDADQAVGKEIIAGAMASVKIGTRRFDGQVGKAKVFVYRHLGPHTGVAVDGPGFIEPAVIAEFAGPRNGVELPKLFAGMDIEGKNHAFGGVVGLRGASFAECGAYENDAAARDRGRGVEADLAGVDVDGLAGAVDREAFEIDEPPGAEGANASAGMGVEGYELVTRGDINDAVVTFAIGPVRDAAAGELTRRIGGAGAFTFGMGPDEFARSGVEGYDRATGTSGGVDDAIDHEGRAFQFVFGAGAEMVGFEAPRNFEFIEVGRVDLIERGVTIVAEVSRVGRPFPRFGRALRGDLGKRG